MFSCVRIFKFHRGVLAKISFYRYYHYFLILKYWKWYDVTSVQCPPPSQSPSPDDENWVVKNYIENVIENRIENCIENNIKNQYFLEIVLRYLIQYSGYWVTWRTHCLHREHNILFLVQVIKAPWPLTLAVSWQSRLQWSQTHLFPADSVSKCSHSHRLLSIPAPSLLPFFLLIDFSRPLLRPHFSFSFGFHAPALSASSLLLFLLTSGAPGGRRSQAKTWRGTTAPPPGRTTCPPDCTRSCAEERTAPKSTPPPERRADPLFIPLSFSCFSFSFSEMQLTSPYLRVGEPVTVGLLINKRKKTADASSSVRGWTDTVGHCSLLHSAEKKASRTRKDLCLLPVSGQLRRLPFFLPPLLFFRSFAPPTLLPSVPYSPLTSALLTEGERRMSRTQKMHFFALTKRLNEKKTRHRDSNMYRCHRWTMADLRDTTVSHFGLLV